MQIYWLIYMDTQKMARTALDTEEKMPLNEPVSKWLHESRMSAHLEMILYSSWMNVIILLLLGYIIFWVGYHFSKNK